MCIDRLFARLFVRQFYLLPAVALCVLAACKDGGSELSLETAAAAQPAVTVQASQLLDAPDYSQVFPRTRVNRLDITIAPADWHALEASLRAPNSAHVSCTVKYSDKEWNHVAIFTPRNTSLALTLQAGSGKLPFELRFDELGDRHPDAKDQRFYGFRALSLGNNAEDSSFLRQRAAGEILRDENVPSPYSAFYRVFVDFGRGSIYFGLYTVVEVPELPFLDTRFGDSSGNLYRAAGSGATLKHFVESSFVKETNPSTHDFSDVKALITALNADHRDRAAWRASLEATLDVDGFLDWLAVNTVIENWDAYGVAAHNYALYANPKASGRFSWIPTDNSQALKPGPHGSLSIGLREVGAEWPLIRELLDDPVYRDAYFQHVAATAEAAFSQAEMEPLYTSMHALIAPYVTGPAGEIKGYTFLRSAGAFEHSVAELLEQLNRRQDAVKRALLTR